ncbi:MAG TPA: adenylate/guanylate cyclase domain-containing protein [Myxococcaceae bacterium]|nr:adenylate/guanylate cyclase domain-containing protein [Myxococcaceae bacterium]
MTLSLRKKLLAFSLLLAILPIGVAGRSLLTLTQDELKSSVNDELVTTADQLARELDELFAETWRAPLVLLRNTLESEELDGKTKLSLLTGVKDLRDVTVLQVSIEGSAKPILIAQDAVTARLAEAGLEPGQVLAVTPEQMAQARGATALSVGGVRHVPALDTWLLTVVVPLRGKVGGREATLFAQLDLARVRQRLREHAFTRMGELALVDKEGRAVFDPARTDLGGREVVRQAQRLLRSGSRAAGVTPSTHPDGRRMVAAYAIPTYLPWAVIAERDEAVAYATLGTMTRDIAVWLGIGALAALVGAIAFSRGISRPVLEVAEVARKVGEGDFDSRVRERPAGDEIALLGRSINRMIGGLQERDRVKDVFGRYVTKEVMQAVLDSPGGLDFGGERRKVTIMMTDLRGFTALSERLQPEQVVQMLNEYFEIMVDICVKHRGTINEIIGDALLVIFGAPLNDPHHARQAIACAIDMQLAMGRVNEVIRKMGLPDLEMGIGLNTGEVVVGNIGSKKRTKYAVVGSDVNLTSRIESYTTGGQVLVSEATLRDAGRELVRVDNEMQVEPKGVKRPITIFQVGGIGGDYGLFLPEDAEQLWPPSGEVAVEYAVLEGKHLVASGLAGTLVRLSERCAEVRLVGPLEPLTNVKLQVTRAGAELQGKDVYGKVIKASTETEGCFLVRFTSVPAEVAAYLGRQLPAEARASGH